MSLQLVLVMVVALLAVSCASNPVTDAPKPFGVVPSPPQLAWHQMELNAFVHFTVNTFTDREWGEGTESPEIFNPTSLDCHQWAQSLTQAGFNGMILTAKHHDGFCLWPSKFTKHTVASSPWKNGKGDVVREAADACRKAGLKFGVYLSPWDRHEPIYGDSPKYNQHYKNQLNELLSGYEDLFEIWFDGACGEGPNGKRQEYDFPVYHALVRKMMPGAVMFSDVGPDVRWVGNENGFAGETNWNTLNIVGHGIGTNNPPSTESLSSGDKDAMTWIPAECDVSIRPGWFWHESENDKVKSVAQLMEIYERSVGHGGVLLLNIPPDRRGLFHENDVNRLKEFRVEIDRIYGTNLTNGATANASSTRGNSPRFAPANVLDNDPTTYWTTDDTVTTGWIELTLPRETTLDRVVLMEHIALGQRIAKFSIDVMVDGNWKQVATGTTVGHKRIVRFPATSTDRVRINIEESLACSVLALVSLHLSVVSGN